MVSDCELFSGLFDFGEWLFNDLSVLFPVLLDFGGGEAEFHGLDGFLLFGELF